nr:probable acyl-CoA dehydrogenase IBR3 [Tanacetum cinerariifolium]
MSTSHHRNGFTDALEEIPSSDEYLTDCCTAAGKPWPAAGWKFYVAFSLFRGASILAGVHTRYIMTSNTLHNAIMEAGGKDRPPMLAPGNYVQWKSRIKRYIDTKPNHELIHYCLKNPPYEYTWKDKVVPVFEGSFETTTERCMENYKNVSQDIRDQLNAEAEAVQIILTGIDNDIYSIIDVCPNACEMWKAIKKLKQDESINVQDLETNLYWEFRKFTSRDGESLESYYSRFYKMMNELVMNQYDVTNHQVNV